MTRRAQIAVLVTFVVVLVLPVVLYAAGVRPAMTDNRSATAAPDLSGDAVLRIETYEQLDGFVTDRLPLRDRAIAAEVAVDDALSFPQPPVAEGLAGDGRWLNLDDTLVEECAGPPVERFLGHVDRIHELATEAGVPFRVLVPPDKIQVYPERRPTEGLAGFLGLTEEGLPGCAATWQAGLDAAAADRPWLLPAVGPMVESKGTTADDLFLRLDSHWSDTGAAIAARLLVESLAPGTWDPAALVPAGTAEEVGDLTRLLGQPATETVNQLEVSRPGVTVTTSTSGPGAGTADWNHTVWRSAATSTGPALVPGRTVVVGDSFLRAGIHLLQPYFEELVFVPWQLISGAEGLPLLEAAGAPADNLVVFQVQRSLAEGRVDRYVRAIEAALVPS